MKAKSKKYIALSLILLGCTAQAFAHKEHFTKSARSSQKSYEFRESIMTIYKWYLSPMGAMINGKTKFNAKTFSQYAKGLETASSMSLLQGFPTGSSEDEVDDSNAKPKIWKNIEDFEKTFKNLQKEASLLASFSQKADLNAIKAQFKKTADICTSCHKKYKTK